MSLPKRWATGLIIGISVILGIWFIFLFVRAGWLSDAPGFPWSVILTGWWFVVLSLGWSIARLRSATGTRRIPRVMNVVAAGLFAIGMLLSSRNLVAQANQQPSVDVLPLWLVPLALILWQIASLVESVWDKPDVRAWLRVSGAALISATLLVGFLIVWSIWF